MIGGTSPHDTIYALSSGRPPAGIAVIRLSGSRAQAAALTLCASLPEVRSAAVRTLRDQANGELLDEALVLRFDAPDSVTGEDVVELHCHGGRAVVEAVLAALSRIEGLREARPGEFTRRAFENGRIDLTEAEGLADLLEAETESQRQAALLLAKGGLSHQIEDWSRRVVDLSAQAEQAIDFADEGLDDANTAIGAGSRELAEELGQWLARPRAEPLKEGVRVVAAGPPNSGKSSLINAISGSDRVIVSEQAGTTRDVIEVPLALGGLAFTFADTAGLRDTAGEIEAIGIARAEAEIERSDILLWLGPPEEVPVHQRTILVHSKADIAGEGTRGSLPVSALTGSGLGDLLERIAEESRALLPGEGSLALNRRQAEAVAEACAALDEAAGERDPAIQAEALRSARAAFDRCVGRSGVEHLLDALFSRFCLGK